MPSDVPIPFPFQGVSDRAAYEAPAGSVVPPDALRNVRAFDVTEDRGRGGQRPGAWPVFNTQICGGAPIQLLETVSQASRITGYQPTACADVTVWEPRDGQPITGQVWMLGAAPGMFRDFADSRVAGGGKTGVACCWHPLITNNVRRAFYAATFNDAAINGAQDFVGIACVDELGTTLWTANLDDRQPGGALAASPRAISCNHIGCYTQALGTAVVLVSVQLALAGSIQGYIYVYKASDGTFLQRFDLDGWAGEVQQTCQLTNGDIVALFWGAPGTVDTTASDGTNTVPVLAGGFGSFFRSGVARYTWTGVDLTPLTRSFYGGTRPADALIETGTAHGTFRFSEQLQRRPRGVYPTAMAPMSGNRLLVTFSNKGWGPNASYTPADNAGPYSTVAIIDAQGHIYWEADSQSILRAYVVGATTYYNDIPTTGDALAGTGAPSLFSAAVDSDDIIYVGGARNDGTATATAGFNLFAISPIDGRILWRTNIGGSASAFSGGIAQNGIKIDPTDGHLLVAGLRNDAWTGASSKFAHLWKINRDTGAVLWSYDLMTANKNAYSVDVDATGRIIYATTFI